MYYLTGFRDELEKIAGIATPLAMAAIPTLLGATGGYHVGGLIAADEAARKNRDVKREIILGKLLGTAAGGVTGLTTGLALPHYGLLRKGVLEGAKAARLRDIFSAVEGGTSVASHLAAQGLLYGAPVGGFASLLATMGKREGEQNAEPNNTSIPG